MYPLDSLGNFKSWKRLGKSETVVSKNSDTASKVLLFIEIDYSSFVWIRFYGSPFFKEDLIIQIIMRNF